MIITKAQDIRANFVRDNTEVVRISYYKYIGASIAENTDQINEIRYPVEGG